MFVWKDYSPDMTFIEDWIDDDAARFTGLDDGWLAEYDYRIKDGMVPGKDYWCKIVFDKNEPVAAVELSLYEGSFTIMELLVKPDKRGGGYGSALLCELISEGEAIIGHRIERAEAVIFPNNIPSQKAFEKAGFVFDHAHEDGDAWYYIYESGRIINNRERDIVLQMREK